MQRTEKKLRKNLHFSRSLSASSPLPPPLPPPSFPSSPRRAEVALCGAATTAPSVSPRPQTPPYREPRAWRQIPQPPPSLLFPQQQHRADPRLGPRHPPAFRRLQRATGLGARRLPRVSTAPSTGRRDPPTTPTAPVFSVFRVFSLSPSPQLRAVPPGAPAPSRPRGGGRGSSPHPGLSPPPGSSPLAPVPCRAVPESRGGGEWVNREGRPGGLHSLGVSSMLLRWR